MHSGKDVAIVSLRDARSRDHRPGMGTTRHRLGACPPCLERFATIGGPCLTRVARVQPD